MTLTQLKPREIKRNGPGGLAIKWSDGSYSTLSSSLLRHNCPCAECRQVRGDTSHSAPLNHGVGAQATPSARKAISLKIVDNSTEEQLNLSTIWSVGNYAVGIQWGDGHSTGIYTFPFLAELADKELAAK